MNARKRRTMSKKMKKIKEICQDIGRAIMGAALWLYISFVELITGKKANDTKR